MTDETELKDAARLLLQSLQGFDAGELKSRVSEVHAPTYNEAIDRLNACLYDVHGNCK